MERIREKKGIKTDTTLKNSELLGLYQIYGVTK